MRVKIHDSIQLHIPIAKLRGLSIIKVGMNLTKFVLMPAVIESNNCMCCIKLQIMSVVVFEMKGSQDYGI